MSIDHFIKPERNLKIIFVVLLGENAMILNTYEIVNDNTNDKLHALISFVIV